MFLTTEGRKMRLALKLSALAAVVRMLVLVAIPMPAAASEFCLINTSGMRGCGFETMQQCLDSLSGTAGACARDPLYQDPRSALAYQPKPRHPHSKKTIER
jgi:hypothetical protein